MGVSNRTTGSSQTPSNMMSLLDTRGKQNAATVLLAILFIFLVYLLTIIFFFIFASYTGFFFN